MGEVLGKPAWSQEFIESCRRSLQELISGSDGGVLQVCSCGPGEGRSSVAAAMALSICRTYGDHVALLDLNFGRGAELAEMFRMEPTPGLADWLEFGGRLRVITGGTNRLLHLVPAGENERDPAWLCRNIVRREVVETFLARFPWVVMDLPPLIGDPVAAQLTALGDWHVLVGRYRQTVIADLAEAADMLRTGGGGPTGFVLTGDRSRIPRWLRRLI
jgi:Mrp family chromosome partitioning ATPase